jgi:hypothetical protein
VIGIAVGTPSPTDHIPQWRRDRGATVPECVHAVADDWPGPACNFGHDPAVKRIEGWLIEAGRVTCWACRHPGGEACADATCGPCRRTKSATGGDS